MGIKQGVRWDGRGMKRDEDGEGLEMGKAGARMCQGRNWGWSQVGTSMEREWSGDGERRRGDGLEVD